MCHLYMLSAAGADTSSWSAGSPFMHLVSCNMSCCWGYEWERSNALGEAGLCGQGAFSSCFLVMPRHCGAGLHRHDGQVHDQAGVGGCELLPSHESSEEALCTYRPFCRSAVLFQQGTRYNESHFPPWYLVRAFMEACSF